MTSLVLTDSSQLTTLKSYQTKLCIPTPNHMICEDMCLQLKFSEPFPSSDVTPGKTPLSPSFYLQGNTQIVSHLELRRAVLSILSLPSSSSCPPLLGEHSILYTDREDMIHLEEILLTSGTLPSDIAEMNLSQLRLHYMRSLVYNLLECNGYTVIHPQERQVSGSAIQIHLALSSSNSALLNRHEVVCAPVVNSKHDTKEDSLLARHYLKQRTADLELMSRHKYGEQVVGWGEYLRQLGEAVVKVDLLHVKPGKVIPLDLQPTTSGRSRHTSCKGAAFVLYNCARLAAICKQFDDKVAEGYYPHLIPLQDVDFSLLKHEEEVIVVVVVVVVGVEVEVED
uniref:Uncharacterized protein n=1 Tax=Timema douglasi TaxID=61478 RepID=A0A7R8VEX0_TIMDO|nr:unnamed protein product [Timema douglasi]